ncbi:MAG: preprotein translocase subunit SecE [Kiritimatiellaeota bacterium]|nr:preprotein translocase subunit SecE [Kiritimatiellota bacterium]
MDEQEKSGKGSVRGFIDDVWTEFGKISWPTFNELKGSTWLVMAVIAILGAFVFLCDQVLVFVMRAIMGH